MFFDAYGKGVDAYDCTATGIDFITKPKEEIKMIGIEQYRKIQEYKALGLAQTKTAKALGITYSSVSKYWNMSEKDYVKKAEKERYHMDNYRQYILEQLKLCPQIRDTNVYLKLMEAFPDLQVK
ncbi:hypothetical protein [Thermoanaerobacterium thermosaccharolyticum]|uniref:hypothetical protein n=1 Tax=Thermoanaerobacterium thermosaccharolyticum TaxID=1517 RepID=UPI0018C8C76A|nr:hypothetical protein [Thermoanaerobacterium thermosaccharolyticum]